MTRFILGILACLLVQAFGWPRLEAAIRQVDRVAKTTFQAASDAARE